MLVFALVLVSLALLPVASLLLSLGLFRRSKRLNQKQQQMSRLLACVLLAVALSFGGLMLLSALQP